MALEYLQREYLSRREISQPSWRRSPNHQPSQHRCGGGICGHPIQRHSPEIANNSHFDNF
jgi:hypothetical protein